MSDNKKAICVVKKKQEFNVDATEYKTYYYSKKRKKDMHRIMFFVFVSYCGCVIVPELAVILKQY